MDTINQLDIEESRETLESKREKTSDLRKNAECIWKNTGLVSQGKNRTAGNRDRAVCHLCPAGI